MDVIYADELVALNALIDYLLLCLGARLCAMPLRRGRFALAGLLGGLYALGAAAWPWLRVWPAAVSASLLVCLAAYGGGRGLWRGWGAFLAVSALFAGAAYAGALLAGQPPPAAAGVAVHLSRRLLALSFGVCWAGVRFALGRLEKRAPLAAVTLQLGARSVRLRAMRDTGNRLADPVSGQPVLIADASALTPLLGTLPPPETLGDAAALCRELSRRSGLEARLRLVPYAALGNPGALLVCLRPDAALIDGAERSLLVGVSPTPLGNGDYNAIL